MGSREHLCRRYGRHDVLQCGLYKVSWLRASEEGGAVVSLFTPADTRMGRGGHGKTRGFRARAGVARSDAAMCVSRYGDVTEDHLGSAAAAVGVFVHCFGICSEGNYSDWHRLVGGEETACPGPYLPLVIAWHAIRSRRSPRNAPSHLLCMLESLISRSFGGHKPTTQSSSVVWELNNCTTSRIPVLGVGPFFHLLSGSPKSANRIASKIPTVTTKCVLC